MKTIGIFSVSKVEDSNIFFSESFILLKNKLKLDHGIDLFIPSGISEKIEGKSPKCRADQLNLLFKDDKIDFLWSLTGGSASNEILKYLDYDLIKKNNKPIIGYSDVTVLINAIYNKTGLVSFLGPNLKTLLKNNRYSDCSFDFFKSIFINQKSVIHLEFREKIFDPSVDSDLSDSNLVVLKEGKANSKCIGGNLSSICLLFGTKYFDSLENKILFIEECDEFSIGIIRRNLFQFRDIKGFDKLSGVVFGFVNKACFKDYDYTLDKTILDVFGDLDIPIIKNALFGHISPMQVIPIGGEGEIDTYNRNYFIKY